MYVYIYTVKGLISPNTLPRMALDLVWFAAYLPHVMDHHAFVEGHMCSSYRCLVRPLDQQVHNHHEWAVCYPQHWFTCWSILHRMLATHQVIYPRHWLLYHLTTYVHGVVCCSALQAFGCKLLQFKPHVRRTISVFGAILENWSACWLCDLWQEACYNFRSTSAPGSTQLFEKVFEIDILCSVSNCTFQFINSMH